MVALPIGLALQFIVDSEPLRKVNFSHYHDVFKTWKLEKIHAWKTSRRGFEPTSFAHQGKQYKRSSALDHLATAWPIVKPTERGSWSNYKFGSCVKNNSSSWFNYRLVVWCPKILMIAPLDSPILHAYMGNCNEKADWARACLSH